MVHVKDEGSHFDAPVDMIWKYVQSEVDHGEAHKGRRNFQRTQLGPAQVELAWEQETDGKWVKSHSRLSLLPPVGIGVEVLEGPLAGSKFFNYYTPKGSKTEVTVVGEYTSPSIPAEKIHDAVMANNDKVFKEDSEAIRAFMAKK